MTNDERRKVFWLLKKYSSYTAWKAVAEAYGAFTDAWLVAVRSADETNEFDVNATKEILDGRIAFEKGLPKLKAGDRSVWRGNHDQSFAAWGALLRAMHAVSLIQRIMDPREYVFDWMKNKDDVLARKTELEFAGGRVGAVLERPQWNEPAPVTPEDALQLVHPEHGYTLNDAAYLNFPASLPQAPEPAADTVDTGSEVPFYGIYEPEWGALLSDGTSGLFSRLKTALSGRPSLTESAEPEPGPRREHTGCMNYLLAGTLAPPYRDRELDPPMRVTWRLIWKDDRYLDGSIPPEEAQYLAPLQQPQDERLRCEANQPCPRPGYWFTPARIDSRRRFDAGEVMPDVGGDYGATIWQWDPKQQARSAA